MTVRRHLALMARSVVMALVCVLCFGGGRGTEAARASAQADGYDYVVNLAANYNYSSVDVPPCAGCNGPSSDSETLNQDYSATTSLFYDPSGGPSVAYVSAGGSAIQTSVAGMPSQTFTDFACYYQTQATDGILSAATVTSSSQTVTWGYDATPEDLSHYQAHQSCSGSIPATYVPHVPLCYDDNGGDHCASGLQGKRLTAAQSKAFRGRVRISKRALPFVDHLRSVVATLTGARTIPPAVPGGTPGSARASLKVKTFTDWYRVKKKSPPTKASEQIDKDELQRMQWDVGPPPTDQAAFVPILPDSGSLTASIASNAGTVLMTGTVTVRRLRAARLALSLTAAGKALLTASHSTTDVRGTIAFKPSRGGALVRLTQPLVIPSSP